ncbi:hypothetical protein [uncultured Roseovarius sp.]|uniref:hypothetical protein n=1 Tax=uncultured Roseovarius sp. TaxID=293344 RepID=UPI002607572B|nr:hypothetical protein [uncultured Roseovarius sp.]
MAFLLAILVMATLPLILPSGRGDIDHLVLPVIFFPLIWSTLVVLPVTSVSPGRIARLYVFGMGFCISVIALTIAL